jgi:pyruvate formate lyase activating enzyme
MTGSKTCSLCGATSVEISLALGVCAACVARPEARATLCAAHARSRRAFGLPAQPPRQPQGVRCALCANECVLGEGEYGFCGLREASGGHLHHLAGTPQRGMLSAYRDSLPTNCVADWVCGAGIHHGQHNLAVFYASCTADCLFCQNWHYRTASPRTSAMISAQGLAGMATPTTFCVCFFGGDPASQMPHALAAAKALARRGVRICWETNGMMNSKLLDAALELSLESGGCVKFDLKAADEGLHLALTGVSNGQTLRNFEKAARRFGERETPPLIIASTLLVPGYVSPNEVGRIAWRIASIDRRIPYALLAFAPSYLMNDLPCTSAGHAREALDEARSAGLLNVRVGNRHLLDRSLERLP